MTTVWNSLFRHRRHATPFRWLKRGSRFVIYCVICLGLLLRKVRAYEVVR